MKKFKFFLILNLIFVMLTSCGTIKEGFSMQKKDNSDEFLVEKKSPLVMPPDFNDLPSPKTGEENSNIKENEIKKLLTDKGSDVSIDNSKKGNSSFENELLKKIKKN